MCTFAVLSAFEFKTYCYLFILNNKQNPKRKTLIKDIIVMFKGYEEFYVDASLSLSEHRM